jgi:serine/threonine-protein kinase ULK/ATG1
MLTDDDVVKLADFGLAKRYNSQEDQLMKTTYGTPYYQAPEILDEKEYNEKADLWSAGVILF